MCCCLIYANISDVCTKFQTIAPLSYHYKDDAWGAKCGTYDLLYVTLAVIGHRILAHNVP